MLSWCWACWNLYESDAKNKIWEVKMQKEAWSGGAAAGA